MEDFIKNIIVEKRFLELTAREKSMINEWAKNEEEFDALKLTFLNVSSFNQEQQTELSPSVKKRLNDRFAAKHVHQKEIWLNRVLIFLFPRDTQVFKKPAFQLLMVALTVALVIPFLWRNETPQYAMNTNVKKIDTINAHEKEIEVQSKELVQENSDQAAGELSDETPEPQVPFGLDDKSIETTIGPLQNPSAKEINQNFNLEEIRIDRDKIKNNDAMIASPSSKRATADFQNLDEISISTSDDIQAEFKKTNPKTVNVSETLDLLTALY